MMLANLKNLDKNFREGDDSMGRPEIETPDRIIWQEEHEFIGGVEKIPGRKHSYRAYLFHRDSRETEEWLVNCDMVDAADKYLKEMTKRLKNLGPLMIQKIIDSVTDSMKSIKIPIELSGGIYAKTSLWNLCKIEYDQSGLPKLVKCFSSFGFFNYSWLEE